MKLVPCFSTQSFCVRTLISHGLYPQALKASAFLRDFHLIDQIYSLFIKSGFTVDVFLGSSLIDCFSKCGDLRRAQRLLLDMPDTDTVVWNALISGYARAQHTEPVFSLFSSLRYHGLKPDIFTLSSLLKACNHVQENEIAHAAALKMGFDSGAFVTSGLVDNYSKSGDLGSAEKCFDECLVVDYVVSTAMISGYVSNGEFRKAREIFMEMRVSGVALNEFSLSSLLSSITDVQEGEQIHGFSVKMGFLSGASTHLKNAVMSMYCNCGSNIDAIKLFDEISDPGVVSWTTRIGVANDGDEAFELFRFCYSRGDEVNEYTMINVLSMIGDPWLLNSGKQIQGLCYKAGFLPVISVSNVLVSKYGKCGKMKDARRLFDEMPCRDCVSWNSLIAGYAENRLFGHAIRTFSQMQGCSLEPTKFTLASILEVVSNSDALRQVMQIHSQIIHLGFASDYSMVSGLITGYGKCNAIDESKRIFSNLESVEVGHINALTSVFVRAGCHIDVLQLFKEIWNLGWEVDISTFSMVFKACGALTDLGKGNTIHSLALKSGIDQDNFIESAMIDLYCKCGSLVDAEKVFIEVSKDNLVAWNAMMMGYAQHGCSWKSFRLFDKMLELGIAPDEITYLGVLYSCCHAGLVKEARTHLNSMLECHGLMPCLEHYACFVDLLGRVGLLEEANKTINQMPINPDAQIWQILLSACSIHNNVELGKFAAEKLLEVQPKNDSAYVLLASLYSSAGMWDDVRKMRRHMKEKTVWKEPGYSWIQVREAIHTFYADDISHPESKGIHFRLEVLYQHMRASSKVDKDVD